MSTPKSADEAAKVAARLLQRAVPGQAAFARSECSRAARIAAEVWSRWRVGPWQWQCKHVRWFLEHGTADYTGWTRYRYWLTIKRLLHVLGTWRDWRPRLTGSWCAPTSAERARNVEAAATRQFETAQVGGLRRSKVGRALSQGLSSVCSREGGLPDVGSPSDLFDNSATCQLGQSPVQHMNPKNEAIARVNIEVAKRKLISGD